MCSDGSNGFNRCTEINPAKYDMDEMKMIQDAGPGKQVLEECFCHNYQRNIKRENPAENYFSRIKSEDIEEAAMVRPPFGIHQSTPSTMVAPHIQAADRRSSTPVRIKYDLSSSDASGMESDSSESSSSEYRPSKPPVSIRLTEPPVTRSKSVCRGANITDHTSPTSAIETGASRPKKHNQVPTDGLFSPPPSSDVDAEWPAIRSPKGKGNVSRDGRAKSRGGERPRGRMLERNPDGSRARTCPDQSSKGGNFGVRKRKHKSRRERNRHRLAREARVERSIEETPSSQMLTPGLESIQVASTSRLSPVSPIPARFAAAAFLPATPGPSRSQGFHGATETPPSSSSLFVTQPRERSTGKRSLEEFEVEPEFTVQSLSQKFAEQCRPLFAEVVGTVKAETEALKKRVEKTESNLNTCAARLDAQSGQVRNLGHRFHQVETRIQNLEQSVPSGSLEECRRQNQELREAFNALRQQQHEENGQREERIKQEILDEFNSGLAKHKADVAVELAKHKAEQEADRNLDREQQAIADHERTKWFEAQHNRLSQTLHSSLKLEREARNNQVRQINTKIAAIPGLAQPPAQEPSRVIHGPFIPEIRPAAFYGLAHRNGMNPPVPGTIPDTLVRAHSRPERPQHAHSTAAGPTHNPPTGPTNKPSAQPTNQPPARPVNRHSVQSPTRPQHNLANQPPTRQGTQPSTRPHWHTHAHSPHQSPRHGPNGRSPAPRSKWNSINRGPESSKPRHNGGGSASQ